MTEGFLYHKSSWESHYLTVLAKYQLQWPYLVSKQHTVYFQHSACLLEILYKMT